MFLLPETEAKFVLRHEGELASLQGTGNGHPRYLLPVAASLLIAHQEILVVDAGQVEVKLASVDAAGPDQTRVAERSIGDNNRQLVQPVIHYVVISHLANRIGSALPAQSNDDDHVAGIERGLLCGKIMRLAEGMKHMLIGIDPCGKCREQDNGDRRRQKESSRPIRCVATEEAPKPKSRERGATTPV